jgi:hypothetical protein
MGNPSHQAEQKKAEKNGHGRYRNHSCNGLKDRTSLACEHFYHVPIFYSRLVVRAMMRGYRLA